MGIYIRLRETLAGQSWRLRLFPERLRTSDNWFLDLHGMFMLNPHPKYEHAVYPFLAMTAGDSAAIQAVGSLFQDPIRFLNDPQGLIDDIDDALATADDYLSDVEGLLQKDGKVQCLLTSATATPIAIPSLKNPRGWRVDCTLCGIPVNGKFSEIIERIQDWYGYFLIQLISPQGEVVGWSCTQREFVDYQRNDGELPEFTQWHFDLGKRLEEGYFDEDEERREECDATFKWAEGWSDKRFAESLLFTNYSEEVK